VDVRGFAGRVQTYPVVSSLEARDRRPSAAEAAEAAWSVGGGGGEQGSEERAEAWAAWAVGDDDDEGEWRDGVLTVVDAVLSGREMLSLRSSDSVGLCCRYTVHRHAHSFVHSV